MTENVGLKHNATPGDYLNKAGILVAIVLALAGLVWSAAGEFTINKAQTDALIELKEQLKEQQHSITLLSSQLAALQALPSCRGSRGSAAPGERKE